MIDGSVVEIHEDGQWTAVDVNRTPKGQGALAVMPVVVPNKPLVLATKEGNVTCSGTVKGVRYIPWRA